MPFDFVAEVRCFFGARLRELEGEPQDPVDADAGEDRLLDDDLALGALEHAPADRGVLALGVLAHDPEVDVAGLAVGERRARRPASAAPAAGSRTGRTRAGTGSASPTARRGPAPSRASRRRRRRSRRARRCCSFQSSGIIRPCLSVVVAARRSRASPAGSRSRICLRRRLEDADALRHDLLADAVAGNDRDVVDPIGRHAGVRP